MHPADPTLCYFNVSVLHFQSFNVSLTNLCIKFSVKITSVISVFLTGPSMIHLMESGLGTTHCRLEFRIQSYTFSFTETICPNQGQ